MREILRYIAARAIGIIIVNRLDLSGARGDRARAQGLRKWEVSGKSHVIADVTVAL